MTSKSATLSAPVPAPAQSVHAPTPALASAQPAAAPGFARLQYALGNRGVARWIQAKLALSSAHDALEDEADRVAEDVVGASNPPALAQRSVDTGLPAAAIAPSPAVLGSVGSGQPLASDVRGFFEPRFGRSFEAVRVHADAEAAASARSIGALAYTAGSDVIFGTGQYRPDTSDGRRLLAHELTHVVQQSSRDAPRSLALGGVRASLRDTASFPRIDQRAAPDGPLGKATTARGILEEEVNSFFCRVSNAWPAIRRAGLGERDPIRRDLDLRLKIRRRASPMDLLKTYLLLTFGNEASYPAHYAAFLDATDRVGTHEARIYAILRGVTQGERDDMRDMPGFVEVLDDELSGSELRLALNLLYQGETRSGTGTSNVAPTHVLEEGGQYDLSVNARESFSTVTSKMENAISSGSPYPPRPWDQRASDAILGDTPLWAQFADEFAPEQVWYLRMLARYSGAAHFPTVAGATTSFITVIWKAVEGLGTDEDKLIGELNAVNAAMTLNGGGGRALRSPPREELKDDPWFVPMLQSELSGGDLRRAYAAVSATSGRNVAIRDSLKSAIDHRRMPEVTRMLSDPNLSQADRDALRNDPKILGEMGDELNGIQLCQVTQLLVHGATPPPLVNSLLGFFTPALHVTQAVTFLRNSSQPDQQTLLAEPGVHYMLVDRNLDYLTWQQRFDLLGALRSHDPQWQSPGSEGTHWIKTEGPSTSSLPVRFTGSEARIQVRLDLDQSKLPSDDRIGSGKIEDWTREIDRRWNDKYRVRSGAHRLELVIDPYIAPGIAPPHVGLFLEPGNDRSYVTGDNTQMHLYVQSENFNDLTVAHELGHVLGNLDEYSLTAADYATVTGTPGQNPPPRGGQSVVGLMGYHFMSPELGQRHVAPAVQMVNQVRDAAAYPDPFVPERK